jgi:predicted tellurium resistance membrane protein TerC
VRAAASLRGAVLTILLADFIMSLDNVLGVAAASGGNIGLLLFGLILSMAILMFGGSLVAEFINRLVWLAYLGAAVIAWTGASMFLEDPFVARVGVLAEDTRVVATVLVTIAVLVVAHLVHRRPAQGLRR